MSKKICFIGLTAFLLTGALGAETLNRSGKLEQGDSRLPKSGEYYDSYSIKVRAGQRIQADLSSTEFDAFLILQSPSGDETSNDDANGSTRNATLGVIAGENGEWKILVTSTGDPKVGSYELKVVTEDLGTLTPYSGKLETGDTQSVKGEYYDTYRFQARDGQRVLLDLVSSEAKFDTYLIVVAPSGARSSNDDYVTANHSYLDMVVDETGEYKVYITSVKPEEVGDYKLLVVMGGMGQVQRFNGRIDENDPKDENGKPHDIYKFRATAGQHIVVEMNSTEFDTFLIVKSPAGAAQENDDVDSSNRNSRLDFTAGESGEYTIQASAYDATGKGAYKVKVTLVGGNTSNQEPLPPPPAETPARPRPR